MLEGSEKFRKFRLRLLSARAFVIGHFAVEFVYRHHFIILELLLFTSVLTKLTRTLKNLKKSCKAFGRSDGKTLDVHKQEAQTDAKSVLWMCVYHYGI